MTRFAQALAEGGDFIITCELIPGRGYAGKSMESILAFVDAIKDFPAVRAVSLTDNAGGNPALSADVVGAEVLARGMDAIVHFSCKDMSRNFIESRAFALKRTGIGNLLVITGDYPVSGYMGLSKPVFDLDSVTALHYLSAMNSGLPISSRQGTTAAAKTDFLLGAAVSPFKWREAACVMQYMKLAKKIRAGAHFIITQLGYDSRKQAELIQYVRGVLGNPIPVLGSVYILTAGAAELMHRGEVPGCWVSPELVAEIKEEARSADKGHHARLERAAAQVAILKGLGYAGAHLEGLALKADDVKYIVGRAAELAPDWQTLYSRLTYAPADPYYYFEGGESKDAATVGRTLVVRRTPKERIASLQFWSLRAMHKLFFKPGTPGFRMMTALARSVEKGKGASTFVTMEHAAKRAMLKCKACDDCVAMETFYVCPENGCPKGMRSGPCGGSGVDERCEVHKDRFCVWHDIYKRAKNRDELEKLGYLIPPRDWSLYDTGSWFNYFLGRDHTAHPLTPVAAPGSAAPPTPKQGA